MKRDSGLGVLDMENLNTALLVKWWWRFLGSEPTSWGSLLLGLYYRHRRPLREGASFKPFSQWSLLTMVAGGFRNSEDF